jgi:hypothetical protein
LNIAPVERILSMQAQLIEKKKHAATSRYENFDKSGKQLEACWNGAVSGQSQGAPSS